MLTVVGTFTDVLRVLANDGPTSRIGPSAVVVAPNRSKMSRACRLGLPVIATWPSICQYAIAAPLFVALNCAAMLPAPKQEARHGAEMVTHDLSLDRRVAVPGCLALCAQRFRNAKPVRGNGCDNAVELVTASFEGIRPGDLCCRRHFCLLFNGLWRGICSRPSSPPAAAGPAMARIMDFISGFLLRALPRVWR